eukprot:11278996-Alexandrium_andersonii.AAC.1
MSASLVGSEMCIRDRLSADTPMLRLPPLEGLAEKLGEGGFPRDRAREAVSYTHLTLPTICSV